MHVYVSIPALDHKIFEYAGYQSVDSDANDKWHRENGITGRKSEILAGPYRVLNTFEYRGDQINEYGETHGEPPNFIPKQFVITRRRDGKIIRDMWVARSHPGDDERFQTRATNIGGMLHCFQVKTKNAPDFAVERHEEIEQAQAGLEDRVAKWRQDQ